MKISDVNITGTLIWYYFICPREVWLMAHQIQPNEDNDFLELGRYLHEESYPRDTKRIRLESIELDVIRKHGEDIVVGEVKKSSRFLKSATMQLLFYLKKLSEYGVTARGELLFPKERKRISVSLTPDSARELAAAETEIARIVREENPPPAVAISFCRHCAYRDFCFA